MKLNAGTPELMPLKRSPLAATSSRRGPVVVAGHRPHRLGRRLHGPDAGTEHDEDLPGDIHWDSGAARKPTTLAMFFGSHSSYPSFTHADRRRRFVSVIRVRAPGEIAFAVTP